MPKPPVSDNLFLMLQKILLIAAAGAAGTLLRFALSGAVQKGLGSAAFPYGTLAVNVIGCFLFGLIFTLAEEKMLISSEARIILLVGFMGAFTTFSTFGFETAAFIRDSQWGFAALNVATQNITGILAIFGGIILGRTI